MDRDFSQRKSKLLLPLGSDGDLEALLPNSKPASMEELLRREYTERISEIINRSTRLSQRIPLSAEIKK